MDDLSRSRVRQTLCILLLTVWALFSSIHLAVRSVQRWQQSTATDDPAAITSAIGVIAKNLPPFGEVGFLEDSRLKDDLNYYATQFALAPRIVVRGPRDWSVRVLPGGASRPISAEYEVVGRSGDFELLKRRPQ